MKRILFIISTVLVLLFACSGQDKLSLEEMRNLEEQGEQAEERVDFSLERVAKYLQEHGQLPDAYLTKKEARNLGWDAHEGNLWDIAPNSAIGGDRFGNREGKLPDAQNRIWYEADIDYKGGYRGSHRIVFSNDGLIYYTLDHYDTFTLWEEEE